MRSTQSGFTLLEMLISIGIMAVVLQTTVSSTLVMSRSGEFGLEGTQLVAHGQQTLARLRHELETTATGVDAAGAPYVTVTGAAGNSTLTFRRIGAFGSTGQELVPVFSTPIKLYRSKRQLIREQDGRKIVLMNDVDSFDVSVDHMGRLDVQIGTSSGQGAATGEVRHLVHELRALPER